MPGVVGVYTAESLGLVPIGADFNPTVARAALAVGKVRYVGEPVAVVVTEEPAAGRRRRRAGHRRLRAAPGGGRHGGARHRRDAALPRRRHATSCSTRASRHARHTDDGFFDGCEVMVGPAGRQPACRAVPARGPQRGGGLGRRPPRPVVAHPARARRRATTSAGARPRGRRSVRVIAPDVGGGFGAKIGAYPEELLLGHIAKQVGRPGALDRDPHREHGGARPRAGPGAARHDRRHPRRQGPRLPARGAPGLPAPIAEIGSDPRAVHDPADVVRRLRHPEDRVHGDVGRHQHHAHRRLPRRRPARGHRRHRAGHGPVRRRDRLDPVERAAPQPDRASSEPYTTVIGQTYDVGDYETALDKVLEPPPATTTLRAEQAAPARQPATRCSSASA